MPSLAATQHVYILKQTLHAFHNPIINDPPSLVSCRAPHLQCYSTSGTTKIYSDCWHSSITCGSSSHCLKTNSPRGPSNNKQSQRKSCISRVCALMIHHDACMCCTFERAQTIPSIWTILPCWCQSTRTIP